MTTYSISNSIAHFPLSRFAGESWGEGSGHVYSLIEMGLELAYGKPGFLFVIPHAKKPGKLLSGFFASQ
jgi:hypothetical protein